MVFLMQQFVGASYGKMEFSGLVSLAMLIIESKKSIS